MDTTATTAPAIAHGSAATADYTPYDGFDAVLQGEPDAGVAWLRTGAAGDGVLYTGMFVAQPSTFRYTFAGDESFHVIEGDLDISVDDGGMVTLRPGDIASFPKGARSPWTIRRPLRKFFVISG